MATAWEVLKQNSTLVSGTAWEHLNNQLPGDEGFYTLVDGLEVQMTDGYDIEVDTPSYDIEVEENLIVELETPEYDVEVD
jgi:hypothetical protein